MATCAIAGTNSAATVGSITWYNSLGGAGSVPASSTGWTFSVALAYGANVISVTGTNAVGDTNSDSVTVTRIPAAFVDVTNVDGCVSVPDTVTQYTLYGTNNVYAVGGIR